MNRATLVFLAATIEFVVIGGAQGTAAGAADHSGSVVAGALEVTQLPASWPAAKTLRFRPSDFEAVTGAETQVVPLRVPLIDATRHIGDFISVIRSWCSGRLAGDFFRAVQTYALQLRGFAVKWASAAMLARVAAQ